MSVILVKQFHVGRPVPGLTGHESSAITSMWPTSDLPHGVLAAIDRGLSNGAPRSLDVCFVVRFAWADETEPDRNAGDGSVFAPESWDRLSPDGSRCGGIRDPCYI